jgi:type IV secretion system protein VirD4
MVSRTETARALLTQGEIMQLPDTDEIVMLAGAHPVRAKKVRYFADPRLAGRVLAPPIAIDAIRAEPAGDWEGFLANPSTDRAHVGTINPEDEEASEGGIRREPEIPEHEDIAALPSAIRNEFAFGDADGDGDDENTAARNRQLNAQVQDNARRATLDPGDGIDL